MSTSSVQDVESQGIANNDKIEPISTKLTHPPGGKIVLSFLVRSVLNILVVLIVIASSTNLDDSRRRGRCERIVPFKRCHGILEVIIGDG